MPCQDTGLGSGVRTWSVQLENTAGLRAVRDAVLTVQTRRIFDLVSLVDELAFHRTEARLAARLLQRAGPGDAVAETHQELALDIGTAREVVSRRLKRFEAQGLVALERGRVRILDRGGLSALTGAEI